ncbi:MAG: endonuclease III [bacterium]
MEGREDKRARAGKICTALKKSYPQVRTALRHENPFQLLIATILSAQCTDERVNQVTPGLFRKYPTPEAFANAAAPELEEAIHSTGFFRQKTKSIQGCSRALIEKFGGKMPREMEELTSLPGVGRKTANLIRGEAFGLPAIVVDTHCRRLSGRLGLSDNTDPDKIEADLCELLSPEEWSGFSNRLIVHGRRVCGARKPNCPECLLNKLCPFPHQETGRPETKETGRRG